MSSPSLSFRSSFIVEETNSSVFEVQTFKRYNECKGEDVVCIGEFIKVHNWPPFPTVNRIYLFKSEFNDIMQRFENIETFNIKFENGDRTVSLSRIEGTSLFEIKLDEDQIERIRLSAKALQNIWEQIDEINKDFEKDFQKTNNRANCIFKL